MSLTIDRDGARTRPDNHQRRRHGGPVPPPTPHHPPRRGGRVSPSPSEGAPPQPPPVRLAVESAADMRSSLLVVDAVAVRPGRRGAGPALRPAEPRLAADLAALAGLAAELGVEMQSVRLAGLRPRQALVGAVHARRAALVVPA